MPTSLGSARFSALLVSALLLAIAGVIFASDNYTVNNGANATITAHAECRTVTNNSATGASAYVPTQTSVEWQSFIAHPPAGVTVSSCGCALPWGGTLPEGASVTAYQAASGPTCVSETRTCTNGVLSGDYQNQSCTDTCAGQYVGGYCWYLTSPGQSCTSACSSHGGCNLAGTKNYAGSSGTNAQCTAVARTLGISDGAEAITNGHGAYYAYGCSYDHQPRLLKRFVPTATTCGASNSLTRRICACYE
jgi:hypothetical protein